MKIRIKKFKLRYGGVTYGAGTVLDLPEADACALIAQQPECFEFTPDAVAEVEKDVNIDTMTVAQLKEFAEENGIDIGGATKKQDIIDAIVAAGEPAGGVGLPDVDLKGTVK